MLIVGESVGRSVTSEAVAVGVGASGSATNASGAPCHGVSVVIAVKFSFFHCQGIL